MLISREKELREMRWLVRYLNMKLKAWKDVLVDRQLLSPTWLNLWHLGQILELSGISVGVEHLNTFLIRGVIIVMVLAICVSPSCEWIFAVIENKDLFSSGWPRRKRIPRTNWFERSTRPSWTKSKLVPPSLCIL